MSHQLRILTALDAPTPSKRDTLAADRRCRQTFVVEMARALHMYGTPTHRLETALNALASRLGLTAQILSTPTSITIAFGPMDQQQVSLLRLDAGAINLEKLADLDALVEQVLGEHVGVAAPSRRAL